MLHVRLVLAVDLLCVIVTPGPRLLRQLLSGMLLFTAAGKRVTHWFLKLLSEGTPVTPVAFHWCKFQDRGR